MTKATDCCKKKEKEAQLMSEQQEIEFKTLLTAEEHKKICHFYHLIETDFKLQTNCYFDTVDKKLHQKGWGLRIRRYPDHGELTLKTPAKNGLLETTDSLSLKQTEQLIQQEKILTNGTVANKLLKEDIAPSQLILLTQLTTKRAEFEIDTGLLAIDESWYGLCHDFELELEVADSTQGKQDFLELLQKWKITYQPAQNKITRALLAKEKNEF